MEDLKDLCDPSEFWEYFYEISKIPRCSGNEKRVRNFIKNEAEKLGFKTDGDKVNNLVVRIPGTNASKDGSPRLVLQSHMDMVCEKNENTEHDFSKDPLKLKFIEKEKDKWLTAEGTTLGADNGVGIAYQLALMKKIHEGELNFGPLEFDLLFTVDEERGLTGASQIGKSLIKGDYLINLDSEEDDRFTVGCAGGKVFTVNIKVQKIPLVEGKNLIPLKLSISGLIGGHSGTNINQGRGNALKITFQLLWKINNKFNIYLNSVSGGNLTNAIPRECHAIFFINESDFSDIHLYINDLIPNIEKLYEGVESTINIKLEKKKTLKDNFIFPERVQNELINVLHLMPNGPILFHPTIKELVHTSTNLATIRTEFDLVQFRISQRSLSHYDIEVVHEKIRTLLSMSSLDIDIHIDTEYPSWPPNFNSHISKLSMETYKELFDKEATIQAIHAGLECAYFAFYFPSMEMISIGPTIQGGHSPDERLDVKSVEKIWRLLVNLLKKLA